MKPSTQETLYMVHIYLSIVWLNRQVANYQSRFLRASGLMASYIRSQSLINTLINVQEPSTIVPAGLYKGVGHMGTPSPPPPPQPSAKTTATKL